MRQSFSRSARSQSPSPGSRYNRRCWSELRYIENETLEGRFVGVTQHGGRDLIATGPFAPGSVYTASLDDQGKVELNLLEVGFSDPMTAATKALGTNLTNSVRFRRFFAVDRLCRSRARGDSTFRQLIREHCGSFKIRESAFSVAGWRLAVGGWRLPVASCQLFRVSEFGFGASLVLRISGFGGC
jgi:hypothetical protein